MEGVGFALVHGRMERGWAVGGDLGSKGIKSFLGVDAGANQRRRGGLWRAKQTEGGLEGVVGCVCCGCIGLVQDKSVGDLHDACFDELEFVTRQRRKQQVHAIRSVTDGHFGLPDANGLDQHQVK